ncbi:MAG: hypothetical protein WCN97_03120 [Thermoleophilia bacterium]
MGLFRRSASEPDAESDLEPGSESGEPVEKQGPVGPTGRPLHPVGAYFEAAFRRFGINILGYTVYTLMCGLLPVGAALIVSASAIPEWLGLFVFFLGFTLGNVLLIALTTALVAGGGRERLRSILTACVATGILGALLATLHPVVAIILYPLIVFPPIVVASGDAEGLRALPVGWKVALTWFKRTYACLLGIFIVTAAVWFGFTIFLSPLQDELQKQIAFAITTYFVWPISALVFRNLYGDVTGRLVINAPPNEDANRKALMKKRREKSKRNRERIKKVTGEE